MKKTWFILAILIFLCLGGTCLAEEWALGHENYFLLSEMTELGVTLGLFGEEGALTPQGFGEAQFTHWVERQSPSAFRLLLRGGQYGLDHTKLTGLYTFAAGQDFDLQIGLSWEQNRGVQDQLALLQGNWQTDLGLIQAGVAGGTYEGAHLQYEGEAQLLDRLSLKLGTGIRFKALEDGTKWTVPVGMSLTFDLAKDWNLKFAAEDAFSIGKGPDEDPLKLGLVVQRTFDLRGKKEGPIDAETRKPAAEVQAEEESAPIGEQSVSQQPEQDDPAPIEPLPAEENPAATADTAPEAMPDGEQAAPPATAEASDSAAPLPGTSDQPAATRSEQSAGTDQDRQSVPANSYDPVTGILCLNGKTVRVEAVIENGEAYIPIRYTVNLLGGQVYWYGDSRTISIVLDEAKIFMVPHQAQYMRDGETVPLNDSLELWSGHYYIPADRFIELVGIQ